MITSITQNKTALIMLIYHNVSIFFLPNITQSWKIIFWYNSFTTKEDLKFTLCQLKAANIIVTNCMVLVARQAQ